jgi:hypothetical protein
MTPKSNFLRVRTVWRLPRLPHPHGEGLEGLRRDRQAAWVFPNSARCSSGSVGAGHRDIDLGPKPHHGPFLSQRRLLELLVAVALRNGAAVQ